MGINLLGKIHAMKILRCSSLKSTVTDISKGHLAVCIGQMQNRRFVIPIACLSNPSFQDLLRQVEEEFGFCHPMGGLTIPCDEDDFLNVTNCLDGS